MVFILFIRYMRSAPLNPREGYKPGDPAVKRMNRQPRTEVTTIVAQVVTNAYTASGQTTSNNVEIDLRSVSKRAVSLAMMNPFVNQKIAATGRAVSQNVMNICMRTLTVSRIQIGYLYRQAFAVRLSSMQRPVRRAGAPSHISPGPTSLRMGVSGVIQDPLPTVTLLAIPARIPILQPLSRRTGPTFRCWPVQLVVWTYAPVWMATLSPMEMRSRGPER